VGKSAEQIPGKGGQRSDPEAGVNRVCQRDRFERTAIRRGGRCQSAIHLSLKSGDRLEKRILVPGTRVLLQDRPGFPCESAPEILQAFVEGLLGTCEQPLPMCAGINFPTPARCQRRLERKWTQAELAHRCALHRTFIGSVERGERNLSVLNLRLISRVLRVSLVDLFNGLS
jgi:DNA-binding XRE family transcriptional regulator